jgi:hypothetical protein
VIKLGIRRVKPEEVERLREWMAQVGARRPEVLATFEQEGMRHEQVYLLDVPDGPILVYAMEAADHERAAKAFLESTLPIDVEHRAVMKQVLGGPVRYELLFDCEASGAGPAT